MKVLIAAGGTGGHVFPALAVAQCLRARGHELAWAGAPGSFEARVVPSHAIRMEPVNVVGLRGKGVLRWLRAPLLLLRAVVDAVAALRRQRPAVVLGMGGFVAGPVGIAARLLHVPLVIHEQNAAAGLTNRWLARIARRVLEAFPGSLPDAVVVGNPVRAGFAELEDPATRITAHEGPVRVLVVGGSQGARALNEFVPAALARLPRELRPLVRHQGGRTLEVAQRAYAAHGIEVELSAFIDDMPAAYGWADLVLCRAGASTVAELAAAGCAALLVPYPYAVDDHQTANAEYLVRAGAARLLPERELSADRLAAELARLCADRGQLARMASAARAAAWPDAATAIAQACEGVARC